MTWNKRWNKRCIWVVNPGRGSYEALELFHERGFYSLGFWRGRGHIYLKFYCIFINRDRGSCFIPHIPPLFIYAVNTTCFILWAWLTLWLKFVFADTEFYSIIKILIYLFILLCFIASLENSPKNLNTFHSLV